MTRTNNKSCSSLMLHQIKTCSDFIGCNPEESRMINGKDKQFHQELDINCYIFESSICGKNTRYYCPVAATESLHHMVLFTSELRPSQKLVKYLKRCSLRGWNVSAQLEELQPQLLLPVPQRPRRHGLCLKRSVWEHLWGFTPRASREMWLLLALQDRTAISYSENTLGFQVYMFQKQESNAGKSMGNGEILFQTSLGLTGGWKPVVKGSINLKSGFTGVWWKCHLSLVRCSRSKLQKWAKRICPSLAQHGHWLPGWFYPWKLWTTSPASTTELLNTELWAHACVATMVKEQRLNQESSHYTHNV